MKGLESGVKKTTIHIGGVYASREPALVSTVLGSCVSACLFDPVAKVGGMNHFMLPDGVQDGELPSRYGVHAMEMLINEIMKLGGDRRRFQAKVFGGGHVLKVQHNLLAVPERNMLFIKAFLATEKISIVAQRLGGTQPLQVHFYTHTGKAWIKALGASEAKEVEAEEHRYRVEAVRGVQKPAADDITLF